MFKAVTTVTKAHLTLCRYPSMANDNDGQFDFCSNRTTTTYK